MMAAVAGYHRVLVQLKRTRCDAYQRAVFGECVLDALGLFGEGQVECHLQDNSLYLKCPDMPITEATTVDICTNADVPTTATYTLMHPPFCPCHQLAANGRDVEEESKDKGVAVGVAVLLEAADERLLLTRRAAHMRTFPNTWVPPGGHIEEGESLEDAVLRELEEETGLKVSEDERRTCHVLGMWESVYPPILGLGDPQRQHVVVYLHVLLERSSTQLQSQLKLCPDEVDAAAWLTRDLVQLSVFSQVPGQEETDHDLIPITLINRQGDQAAGTVESSVLISAKQPEDMKPQRVSTGSRFAMSLWLEQHQRSEEERGSSQRELYDFGGDGVLWSSNMAAGVGGDDLHRSPLKPHPRPPNLA